MKYKYKCRNCGHYFKLCYEEYECPRCKSMDITEIKKTTFKDTIQQKVIKKPESEK